MTSATILPFLPKRTLFLPERRPDLAAIAAAFVRTPETDAQLYAEWLTGHPEYAEPLEASE